MQFIKGDKVIVLKKSNLDGSCWVPGMENLIGLVGTVVNSSRAPGAAPGYNVVLDNEKDRKLYCYWFFAEDSLISAEHESIFNEEGHNGSKKTSNQ